MDCKATTICKAAFLGVGLPFAVSLLVFCLDCNRSSVGSTTLQANGDTLTIQGAKILVLQGTHQERGYTYGFLVGEQVKNVFEEMLFADLFEYNDSTYTAARTFVASHFTFEDKYIQEACALVQGMKDAGVSLFVDSLGRDMDSLDILISNSIEELITLVGFRFGCTSISSWGQATLADTVLQGNMVITRHWDYPPLAPMINNLLLIVHIPAEEDEQNWVSASWAGNMGACTGINQSRVGAFLNYGNYNNNPNVSTFHPVSLSIRNAIELRDYNGDGACSPKDVIDAVGAYVPYFSTIIHTVASVDKNLFAAIIESNNEKGLVIRDSSHNTVIPGKHLVATNHFRVLYPPTGYIPIYTNMIDSLTSHGTAMTIQRSWDLMSGAAGHAGCIYKIQFVPVTGAIRWAVAAIGQAAYTRPYASLTLDQLFKLL